MKFLLREGMSMELDEWLLQYRMRLCFRHVPLLVAAWRKPMKCTVLVGLERGWFHELRLMWTDWEMVVYEWSL